MRSPSTRVPARVGPVRRRRTLLAGVVALAVVLLTGCQTKVLVWVAVDRDGAGSVAVDVYLDAEAADAVGDLSEMLAVDDLVADGWEVTGPDTPANVAGALGDEGSDQQANTNAVQVHLERPFADIDEANAVLASLGGPEGPLRDVRLSRTSSAFKATTGFEGTVDLSRGLDAFGDAALTETLGGSLSEVVAASGDPVPEGDDLVVGLALVPSSKMKWSGETGDGSMRPAGVGVSAGLGAPPESVDVHATNTRWGPVVGAVAIVALVLVGLVALGLMWRERTARA